MTAPKGGGHLPQESKSPCLARINQALTGHPERERASTYLVPSVWRDPHSTPRYIDVNPFHYYAEITDSLLNSDPEPLVSGMGNGGEWSRRAVVYNMMIRASTAIDHDGDGALGLPVNAQGWRETGTFLKALAMIPFIRSIGANTIHLLPVQEIGLDRRRGNLGSVYAIRDLHSIDETLSEPHLGMSPGDQFRAFIEAAHHSGLRVVLELPLRTTSKDCVWIEDHPDWFYWIPENVKFCPPVFSDEMLQVAREKVARSEREGLPEPPISYSSLFTEPPPKNSIRREDHKFVGTLPDGTDVVIPGAFADWPPNDPQPVWDDITYLKYYTEEHFNYISYNTVRMYPSSLVEGGSANVGLWSKLTEVVSRLVTDYGIDGIMIDMAHALPEALTRQITLAVRKQQPDVAIWAEDFERTPGQISNGYNAVLGSQWECQYDPPRFRDLLVGIAASPTLPPHLASPETHNTRRSVDRSAGERHALYAWTISNCIPAIPYLHSGLELGESAPVNTGFGFTPVELKQFPAERLALFSAARFEWSRQSSLTGQIRKVSKIRRQFSQSCEPLSGTLFSIVDAGNESILAFRRAAPGGGDPFLIIGNSDMRQSQPYKVAVEEGRPSYHDLISGATLATARGFLEGELRAGQVLFLSETTEIQQRRVTPAGEKNS